MRADLHTHTIYSDGKQTPSELALNAKKAGVQILSVTDHDNMDGDAEKRKSIEAQGIVYVPGIEISAYTDYKVHITGYNLDVNSSAYKKFMADRICGAYERAEDIIKKLSAHGIYINLKDAEACRPIASVPLHTMHIARAVAKKGYYSDEYAVYNDALRRGRFAYSRVGRITPFEAVGVIRDAGGIASLAHPGRIEDDENGREALLKKLKDYGLNGIEAVYTAHTQSETEIFKSWAEKYSLLVTGGSDTHIEGFNGCKVGFPYFEPSVALLTALKICEG